MGGNGQGQATETPKRDHVIGAAHVTRKKGVPCVHPLYTPRTPLVQTKRGFADCVVDPGAALFNPRLAPEASKGRVATEGWRGRCDGSDGRSG